MRDQLNYTEREERLQRHMAACGQQPDGHVWVNPHPQGCDSSGCQWCDGGLEYCRLCGSFEGATTSSCPGKGMSASVCDLVYAGLLNFRDGSWRLEATPYSPTWWSWDRARATPEAWRTVAAAYNRLKLKRRRQWNLAPR